MPNSPERQQQQAERPTGLAPLTTATPPSDDPDILLVFHGLFCFARKNNFSEPNAAVQNVCEIGVHTDADRHRFRMVVVEFTPSKTGCDSSIKGNHNILLDFAPDKPTNVLDEQISVSVSGSNVSGVDFHPSADDLEWGRVPDLEGEKFYKRKLDKKPGALKLRLIVKQSLFYTLWATPREFKVVKEDGKATPISDFGKLAYLAGGEMAACGAGGNVTIRFGLKGGASQTLSLQASGMKKYYIFFLNSCPQDGCKFIPSDPDPDKRGDFHQYRKTFKLPSGTTERGVMLKGKARGDEEAFAEAMAEASPLVERLLSFKILSDEHRSSFEAPCGAAYYGQTTDGLGGS